MKENSNKFLHRIMESKAPDPNMVLQLASEQGNRPKTVRVAEFEKSRLEAAQDDETVREITAIFAELNRILPPEFKEFQDHKRNAFLVKLQAVIEKMGNLEFDFPFVGELFMSPNEINNGSPDGSFIGVIDSGRPDLVLPSKISKEDLYKLASLKYLIEAYGIGHIVSGYARSLIDFCKDGTLGDVSSIHFILRDGRIAHASLLAMANTYPELLSAELRNKIRTSYINSAMADPLVSEPGQDIPGMIYTKNQSAISKEQAIDFFKEIGILQQSEAGLILLADTAAMGTIPITLDKARQLVNDPFRMAMVTLAGGWQGNPLIPNFTRFLASGKWIADPGSEDPVVLKKCEIIHTYAENNFSGYSRRPEQLLERKNARGYTKLVPPVEPFNDATSLLAWTSLQAAKDNGELHGLLLSKGEEVIGELPVRSLDFFWRLWIASSEVDSIIPNVAFCAFMTEHSGYDGIMARWHEGILEDIDLNIEK